MKEFPTNTKFKYTWRSYQKMVLDKLDDYLKDKHLHVIAPPGSGKTVLGLEATLRLNKPTLILAPTLTIRDQWIDRLCELFLQTAIIPSWISVDVRKPKFLTIITYQGLHSACSGGNLSDIVKGLKAVEVETFVLDEAHHLKNQWWLTLDKLKREMSPTVIGLTATPPYDASYTEWTRYLDLNGPIDIEISTPELIKEGDLCPHQDYVYFSQPMPEEFQRIHKYRDNISSIYQEYSKSEILIESFMKSSIWLDPEKNLEWIYQNSQLYASYLILLHSNDVEIPEIHFDVLGLDKKEREDEVPEFLYDRLEMILNFFLFQDTLLFTDYVEEKEKMLNKLQYRGAIENKVVNLSYNRNLNQLLVASNSKLNSIVEIVNFERATLCDSLRMVILSDFIRDEYLTFEESENIEVQKIGVVPIFEHILASGIDTDSRVGVLTGSIVILPKSSLTRFHVLCEMRGLSNISPFCRDYRNKHILIEGNTAMKECIVQLVTQLFTEGEIEILVGTKSLLGEGWDAPVINSLILASFVGSFVLSNQMRGRAIRVLKDNPLKTSNIWHLVCIDPTEPTGGQDLDILARRFKSFVGVSNTKEVYIENGLDRLNVKRDVYSVAIVKELNEETLSIARDRANLRDKWQVAVEKGGELIYEIKRPSGAGFRERHEVIKQMYFTRTIAYLISDLVLVLLIFSKEILSIFFNNLRAFRSIKDFFIYLIAVSVVGLFFLGKRTFKTFRLYIEHRDIASDMRNIAITLVKSLLVQGAIKTPESELKVYAEADDSGAISCYLKGATSGEQAIFLNALEEIINTIDNPRYIITREGGFWGLKKKNLDYHAVPTLLGANKKFATYFSETWQELVGKSKLIYTRTMEGRRMLLRARVHSLSAKLSEDKPERYRKWG